MKNYIFLILCCLILSGCVSLQKSESFPENNELGLVHPKASIVVENYGYYLFGIWPIVCGDVEKPNSFSVDLFSDTVTVDNNMTIVKNEVSKYGTNVTLDQIKSEVTTTGSFSAWILWRKIIVTSACVYEIDQIRAEKNEGNVQAEPSVTSEEAPSVTEIQETEVIE